MNRLSITLTLLLGFLLISSCNAVEHEETNQTDLHRAQTTLDAIYKHYGVKDISLLRENYPFDEAYKASYLATDEQGEEPNKYAYLWPYSGTFSAVNVLLQTTGQKRYHVLLDETILPGLEHYFDNKRAPAGYASYIGTAPASDRFYDDNIWLGIDFTELYAHTEEQKYLDKAKVIWDFVMSGMDDKLGGGIYWCEQKKTSKNTCSNAPAAVLALKLFQVTGDSVYFSHGKELYEWTQQQLQDNSDYLYFDNVSLDGKIGKAKFPYNSGQMLQAAALLYQLTGENHYLTEAQNIAQSSYQYFFSSFETEDGQQFRLLKKSDVWFIAVMLRGFVELYNVDQNKTYISVFKENLTYAWNHMREEDGLFNKDWSGQEKEEKKWVLTQAAMVEMYARLAGIAI
ncbi:AGE family epimerase/isomerase [Olivibacter sp. SDN3]|uniref:glycoside hydrolase family 76 protein n=1 Tax=Olivibacter sp. SDN3 TaxID=2764720 RepID=UPI0016512C83|nr:glycoside hydrolase family 76 protein [Olivibacter sp. SDN3]QNL49405.1 AGE family epimerase/isomerase [Olivibacter sp. SDN3]